MKYFHASILIIPVIFLASCSLTNPKAPEINLINLSVSEVTLSHLNLSAGLRVYNPNPIAIDVEEVEYDLSINGIKVSEGGNTEGVRIDSTGHEDINIRISTAYWEIARILNSIQTGEEVNFVFSGLVKVGGLGVVKKTFPFKREGRLPLGVEPE
jgi:LEA14-like dessication related protein